MGPIRESGMPEVDYWESLFDPAALLDTLGFDESLRDVVDVGCGYGTFTLVLAERVSGTIYAVDCDPDMLRLTVDRARAAGRSNVVPVESDLLAHGAPLPASSVDGVLIAHVLHGEAEENVALLTDAHRILRPRGQLGIIHWRRDVETPRGPPLAIRPTLEQIVAWVEAADFPTAGIDRRTLGEYHWGVVGRR